MKNEGFPLPPNLPVPDDDGVADHLTGRRALRISRCRRQTAPQFAYVIWTIRSSSRIREPALRIVSPLRTGMRSRVLAVVRPTVAAFGDPRGELDALGVRVLGLSTRMTEFQKEFVERIHFPFPILSDVALELVRVKRLPTWSMMLPQWRRRPEHAAQADGVVHREGRDPACLVSGLPRPTRMQALF